MKVEGATEQQLRAIGRAVARETKGKQRGGAAQRRGKARAAGRKQR